MADWWMLSGTTSTVDGADGPVMVGEVIVTSCELTTCSVTADKVAAGAITVLKISDDAVSSEKASTNLKTRCAIVTIGSTVDGWAGYLSTGLPLWTAPTPVLLTRIRVSPLTPWQMTTCGETFEFFSCTAGTVCLYCSSSTAFLKAIGDVNSCFVLISSGALSTPQLAACETIRFGLAKHACSCWGYASVQFDYLTTG